MSKSFISKYFDFSQALEFLKDGLSVTNTNYVSHFRILLKDNKFILKTIREEKFLYLLQDIPLNYILFLFNEGTFCTSIIYYINFYAITNVRAFNNL